MTDPTPDATTDSTALALTASQRFADLREKLRNRLVGRDKEADLIVLAMLTGEHVCLVGPPGTGKSELLRTAAAAFGDAAFFETLLHGQMTAEELFGMISVPEMKAGRMKRDTTGFLPEAHFAFADEVWNGGIALLRSMLGVMNERAYRNGPDIMECPLRTLVAASNQWPVGEGYEGVGALFDRFLIRADTDYVPARQLAAVMYGDLGDPPVPMALADLDAARAEVEAVDVPRSVQEAHASLVTTLRKEGVRPSDRRCRQSVKVVKASAWLAGRTQASVADLMPLADVLWNTPADIEATHDVVMDAAAPGQKAFVDAARTVAELAAAVADVNPKEYEQVAELDGKLNAVGRDIEKAEAAAGGPCDLSREARERLRTVHKELRSAALGL